MKKRLLATFLSMAMVAGLATGCSTPGGGKDGGASDGEKVSAMLRIRCLQHWIRIRVRAW